ncbi:MAG TPA: NAD(P)H-dependent oxidoreductase subunit E [Candidatus Polarisedimenticolia bacterium]|nr:NAD(P)H-dependent oxidoreductase subunit E [Candidatus Polarisedimenticolia bacterium]
MTLPVGAGTDRRIDEILTRFPRRGSALLPALHAIQEEKGFISEEAMVYVAGKVGVSPSFVEGVVSFYTMFQRRPVGRHHIQLCRTLPCALRGCGRILEHFERRLGIREGGKTPDGKFSLVTVECLGTCDTAPMVQINDREYGPLDEAKVDAILASLE